MSDDERKQDKAVSIANAFFEEATARSAVGFHMLHGAFNLLMKAALDDSRTADQLSTLVRRKTVPTQVGRVTSNPKPRPPVSATPAGFDDETVAVMSAFARAISTHRPTTAEALDAALYVAITVSENYGGSRSKLDALVMSNRSLLIPRRARS